jgi:AcrR family transcriptional regulator
MLPSSKSLLTSAFNSGIFKSEHVHFKKHLEDQSVTELTAKGERTRELIYTTALELFMSKGYHATTMRDIAAAAGCSLGLAYRYFARKEELVLVLYRRLAQEIDAQVRDMPPALLAQRFEQIMRVKLAQITPYRELFQSLLGVALTPQAELGVLSRHTSDVREQAGHSFYLLVAGATDAPRERQSRDLATVLYAGHLGLLLFWLYDRSPGQRATDELLEFSRDTLKLGRRLLRLPPLAIALARFARAIEPVFGGDTFEM